MSSSSAADPTTFATTPFSVGDRQYDPPAAPLVVNGHLMFQTVYGGKTVVIKPGRKFEVVGVNDLGAEVDEAFRATLSPINGKIYARSHSMLYCIGSK